MSTAFLDCSKYITQRFDAAWTYTAKVYESMEYQPVLGTAFAALKIIPMAFDRITLGSNSDANNNRVSGSIYLEVFTPVNSGVGSALQNIDRFNTLFKNTQFNGVNCYNCQSGQNRRTADGNWFVMPLSCRFEFDEIG